jgi:hypothetical protein
MVWSLSGWCLVSRATIRRRASGTVIGISCSMSVPVPLLMFGGADGGEPGQGEPRQVRTW